MAAINTKLMSLWMAMSVAVFGILYWDILQWMVRRWSTDADYSHGFLVPLYTCYLIWASREKVQEASESAAISRDLPVGMSLLVLATLAKFAGSILKVQALEAASLVPAILGCIAICYSSRAARILVPAIAFLFFMIPLPNIIANQMGGTLQWIATEVSTFGLQTLGIPAVATGNVISLSNGEIGVAEACSGLRMVYAFSALTVGTCMLIDRSFIEKVLIALSAIPIAIAVNCIRILVTGIAFEYTTPETAERIFHDVAGWLMMPVGFVLLLVMLAVLDRAIVIDDSSESRLI